MGDSTGVASQERLAMARALFEEGLGFVDAGHWEEAADRFARVLEMRYSPVVAYNLGLAQARQGQRVVAAETLRKLLGDAALDPKVRDSASTLLQEVEASLAWLQLHVAGPCDSCTLRVDEKDWPSAVWGVAVPIDPGTHLIELMRGGATLRTQAVELDRGARVEQTLRAHDDVPSPSVVAAQARGPASAPSAALDTSAARDTGADSSSLWANPWFWTAVGVVVVGTVTTAIVLGSGSGEAAAMPVRGDFDPGVISGRVGAP
jgi:hypothetical protein